MMIIWCVVALAGLGGLCIAIHARALRGRKHPEVSSEVSAELIRDADQQNRWALRGDTRGVYGAKGAELMRSVSPEPNIDKELDKAAAYPRTAAVASTPEDLATRWPRSCPAGGGLRSSRFWCNGGPSWSRGCMTIDSATRLPVASVRLAAPR
jgi:hypothetical protein